MSALARLLATRGFTISGSDWNASDLSKELEALGELLAKVDAISGDKLVVFTVSSPVEELPESVKKYL